MERRNLSSTLEVVERKSAVIAGGSLIFQKKISKGCFHNIFWLEPQDARYMTQNRAIAHLHILTMRCQTRCMRNKDSRAHSVSLFSILFKNLYDPCGAEEELLRKCMNRINLYLRKDLTRGLQQSRNGMKSFACASWL